MLLSTNKIDNDSPWKDRKQLYYDDVLFFLLFAIYFNKRHLIFMITRKKNNKSDRLNY